MDPFIGFNGPIPAKAQRLLGSCPTTSSSRIVSRRFHEEGDPLPLPPSPRRLTNRSLATTSAGGATATHLINMRKSQKRIFPPQIKVVSVSRKTAAAGKNEELFICRSPSSSSLVPKDFPHPSSLPSNGKRAHG